MHDTLDFVEGVMTTEFNSATDNPMVFTGSDDDLEAYVVSFNVLRSPSLPALLDFDARAYHISTTPLMCAGF